MGRRAIPSTTVLAAVRTYFGLTQAELQTYLGVSRAFISHVEAGRKVLPDAVFLRLLPLARLLPPDPLPGAGRPAPPPSEPPAIAPAREPLEARLDACQHHAAKLRRKLRPFERQARFAARWQAALPDLLASLPPASGVLPTGAETDTTTTQAWQRAARQRRWLEERAAPLSPDDAAEWHLLRLRAEALEAEAATLTALLASTAERPNEK